MKRNLGTYVYLSTLEQTDPEFAVKAKEYSTFNSSADINDKGKEIQPIQDAIVQLKNIAVTQATKEHLAIQNYIKKLDKYINDEACPKVLREKLEQQKKKLTHYNLDFKNFQSDQFELINAINIVQQDLHTYEKRLSEIITPDEKGVVEKRLPYDIQNRVEQFLIHSSENQKVQANYTNVKRDRKFKQMIKNSLNQIKGVPQELLEELYSLIFIDFNNWAENVKDTLYLNIDDSTLETLYAQYLELSGQTGKETHVQKILRTSQEELIILLQDLSNNLHSTYISEKDYNQLVQFVQTATNKKATTEINKKTYSIRQAEQLIDTYNKNIAQNEDKRFSFTLHTHTSHGNFYEFIQTAIAAGANVSANAGADVIIPFATITYGVENEQNQQRLLRLSRNIGQLISDDFNKQETITIENFREQIKKQKNLSKSIQTRMKNTEKTMSKIGELNEDFFIAHESLKLYKSSEEQDSAFQEFHGRKMNILSALAKLYSSPILYNSLIKPEMLITYLINISDVTLAHNKDPLETYLSLFAGLLMFDDIKTLAESGVRQITSNIETSTVDCIHVYNVDGVFIPISVILNNLIEQMNNVMSNISTLNSTGTAIAVIHGPTPEAPQKSTDDAWDQLANSTIQKTTIQIHFLRGFTEYIQQLFTNLG